MFRFDLVERYIAKNNLTLEEFAKKCNIELEKLEFLVGEDYVNMMFAIANVTGIKVTVLMGYESFG